MVSSSNPYHVQPLHVRSCRLRIVTATALATWFLRPILGHMRIVEYQRYTSAIPVPSRPSPVRHSPAQPASQPVSQPGSARPGQARPAQPSPAQPSPASQPASQPVQAQPGRDQTRLDLPASQPSPASLCYSNANLPNITYSFLPRVCPIACITCSFLPCVCPLARSGGLWATRRQSLTACLVLL